MRHKVLRMLFTVMATLAVGYLLLLVWAYVTQERMLYFPSHEVYSTPAHAGLEYKELTLKTTDGVEISAWHIPADNARGLLIFCHGNAGNISHRVDSIGIFHRLGLDVLIFDYRGYGRSGGSPDEEGTYLDAEAAWDYAVDELKVEPDRIILFGRSLGAAVAAELAVRKAGAGGAGTSKGPSPPAGLILESSFTSVPDLGARFYPFLPVRLLARYKYDTINKVKELSVPTLVIHSLEDEIAPYEHGRRIFAAAAGPKEFLQISGGHNDGFYAFGDVYEDGIKRFLDRWLGE